MNATNQTEKPTRRGTSSGAAVNAVILPAAGASGAGAEPRPRYADGWRAGKPAEDPEKLKRWGFVSARPSEFLIRMRGGEVVTAGQGATCFKWPWDSVAIVPTTVQRMHFTADQVTSEKVGVQVTGLAVYRIAEPLVAFRMLNFSFPERASEKLEQMLVEMFVGAVRRLVANLTVEQCLTRRKDGLAQELMREIAPVVSGSGRVEDRTHKGWGVVLDTIEIQDVRVLSQQVFANMQARFRQEQEQKAREAELAKERALKQEEAEAERQIELSRLSAQQEIAEKRRLADEGTKLRAAASEARVAEARLAQQRAIQETEVANARKLALEKLQAELDVKAQRQHAEEQAALAGLEAAARREQAEVAHAREVAAARLHAEAERARLEAEAEQARLAAQVESARHEAALVQAQVELARARYGLQEVMGAIAELEQRKLQADHALELSLQRGKKEIENAISPEAIQLQLAQQLPAVAQAFQQRMGEVHVTAVDGANPFGYIAAAVDGVLGLARSAGLKLPAEQAAKDEPMR